MSGSITHKPSEESSERSGESSERPDGDSTSRVSYPEESSEETNSRISNSFLIALAHSFPRRQTEAY